MTLSHPWDLSPAEARRLQEELRGQVVRTDLISGTPTCVAGIDILASG